ncbi:hypothetical protein D8Y22_21135 [Salinadaptatus halalkaliphilus]|uniref:Uncharacterized protein n=1 Tax=Salinadaptatus halalkaliphilus TaxID=2419781 RepID=A0A4S3TGG3_9EURY|nr:hypothetical protein [Salinadaptatus halalkaliphilus]THE62956.1 hypothetical protein D8Y22_21135 [Salinadaptatus halalkaliphilus]
MSDSPHDQVTEILATADERSHVLVAADDPDETIDSSESAESSLLEAAAEATAFLESADPEDVLAAVGLETLPDGSEPSSIPDAIARGDESRVDDLKRLLNLAKLADDSDEGDLEAASAHVRARREGGEAGDDDRTASETDDGRDETAADDEEPAGEDDETPADIGDAIKSALQSTVTEVGDDVGTLRERLEAASGSLESDNDTDAETDAETASDDGKSASTDADDDTDGDDKFLEMEFGSDDSATSRGVVRHSTVASSPSDRADMRGTARHSTMPDKSR